MAKKNLTADEVSVIEQELSDKKSTVRRRSAKKIGKFQLYTLAEPLYQAYIKESKDKRTWETQVEMLRSLGRVREKMVLPEVSAIIEENIPFDMITSVASLTYVRLKRKDDKDIEPVLYLLKKGEHSVLSGALASLAYDDIIPSDDDISDLIKAVQKIDESKLYEKGYMDPRDYLISAMSKWKGTDSVKAYLSECSQIKHLHENVEYTLAGKKSSWEY